MPQVRHLKTIRETQLLRYRRCLVPELRAEETEWIRDGAHVGRGLGGLQDVTDYATHNGCPNYHRGEYPDDA